MNYIIDLIVLAIIALITFIGYKKGIIKVAFGLISFILAIILSLILYKPISSLIINHTSITSSLETSIADRLSSADKEETDNIISNYYKTVKTTSIPIIANNVAKTIIQIACIIVVFLVTNIILLLFRFSGDLLAKLPLIKQANHILGFIYGLLKGILLIYGLLAIITLLAPILDMNNIITLINSSIITNIMYNNNIIFILFS